MSIINEQNILGNPDLALATRPGSDVTIADYSFGTMSGLYEKVVHEAMGLARGGSWTQPDSYAGEVAQAEVEKESSGYPSGPAGEPTQRSPTQYGVTGDGPLTENAEMKTKNTQAASIVAGETYADQFVNSTSSAVRSDLNKDEGVQGPVSSGGQFNGYESSNQYYGNPNANDGQGDSTPPAPIEDTGIKPYVVPDLSGGRPRNDDEPEGTGKRKVSKRKRTNKLKTGGSSAVKPAGDDGLMGRARVHKSRNTGVVRPGLQQSGSGGAARSLAEMEAFEDALP